ncbi:hypothetical protein [Methylobacterium sp. V23]|uniref:hypothetical protein n=1 Tax=Methylobacterium sp. V23 TaxID=2044878 RepID=UPI000CDA3BFE|nr:hypothetical protein [Methylobacterium sp. V23]POR40228.1 hypothetical protein CRT23_25060 [Methylobacterium sp. V23]
MADDRLRLVAEVQDGFTGPLGKLETALGRTARAGTQAGKDLKKDFDGFHGSIGKANTALQNMTPVLSGLGVAGLATGVSLGAVTAALGGFSKGTQQLAIMSKETGLAVDQLRAFSALGERFGVSAETMQGGVRKFADEMSSLRKRYGETYSSLQAMNLGEMVEKMITSPNMKAALDNFMESVSQIGDPVKRRKVVEMVLGSDQIAAVAGQVSGRYRAVMDEILKAQGTTTDAQVKAAQRFEETLSRLRENMDGLRTQALGPLLVEFNRFVATLNTPDALKFISGEIEGFKKLIADTVAEFQKLDKLGESLKGGKFDLKGNTDRELETIARLFGAIKNALGLGGAPSVQQQSFGGVGFGNGGGFGGGPLIQKAGYGGISAPGGGYGGGGYRGVGSIPPLGLPSPLDASGGGNPNVTGGGAGRGYGGAVLAPSEGGTTLPGPLGGARSVPGISARDMRNVHPEIAAYIRNSAARHGIDPNVALRIANSEGLRGSTPTRMTPGDPDADKRFTSFGPFQLHYAGRGNGMGGRGLGDAYTRETGHHASDATYWKEQIDFAMKHARKGGWGPWHGRIGAGIGERQGIGTYTGPIPPAEPSAAADAGSDVPYYQRPRSNVPSQMSRLRDDEIEVAGSGRRAGDELMGRAFGRETAAPPPQTHRMSIELSGFPAGTRARTSMGDLFKETTVSKSRQVEAI